MKVYVLLEDYGLYEGGANILQVFKSEDAANIALQAVKADASYYIEHYISVWEVT